MENDSQEVKNAQEPQDKNFIQEFKMKTSSQLRAYEQEHRNRIVEASAVVRSAFNDKWTAVMGEPYYQPVTTASKPGGISQRVDPKSKGYKGFWEVIFSPKAKPDDQNDVGLSLNGVCLQMQREVPVVMPGPFLEVADHGVYPTYIQLPGQDRKIAGRIKFFPYSTLREATREEYIEQKASGDKQTKAVRLAETTI